MASISTIHNPLDVDVLRKVNDLISLTSAAAPYINDLEILLTLTDGTQILSALSHLLAIPALTLVIANEFRPLLLDLCARWLFDDQKMDEKLVALCLLLDSHEHLFPVLHRLLQTTRFQNGPLADLPQNIDTPHLHAILLAYFRLIQSNRELPQYFNWPLAPLSRVIWDSSADRGSRLMAIRCYAFQSGMAEVEREKLENEVLGEACGIDCPVYGGQELDGTLIELDGWILPILEEQRIEDTRDNIAIRPLDYYTSEADSKLSFELCPLVVNVHGVLMLRSRLSAPATLVYSPVVPTQTCVVALREMSLHVSLRLPILISAPPSSGKSLLISHLASLLYPSATNQVITIQLADTSLDPRSLLGSYVSSVTKPGTFEWKEGVLISSMRQGKWIVFEDIDKASNEVLGTLKPLFETLRASKWIGGRAYFDVPGRGRVTAAHDFTVFATRSALPSSRDGRITAPGFFGAHKLFEIQFAAPSEQDILSIVTSRYPALPEFTAKAAIALWTAVKQLGTTTSTRPVGLRELEKFCCRIGCVVPPSHQAMHTSDETPSPSFASLYPNIAVREAILLEARDVFFGFGALNATARAHLSSIASTVGQHLELDPERTGHLLNGRVPRFEMEKDANGRVIAVQSGRTRLLAKQTKARLNEAPARPFAMHKPATVLLSRIATAISLNEPLLLTGETGTGKTSVITHLASLLRRPLVSLNLSHQTESSDLLGGFKPVDTRGPAHELQALWLDLFGRTFSRKKNAKFEEEVRKAVGDLRWKRVVALWKESVRLAKERLGKKSSEETMDEPDRETGTDAPRKRRRMDAESLSQSMQLWTNFEQKVEQFNVHHVQGKSKFAFAFAEGPLIKAIRNGDWVLLDEINLASPETLECISGLLSSPTASITLTERGSLEPVPRHPDFRLFSCMNPATDVGKKDLPPNIRSRFTEIDVPPPDADKETLLSIITQYLGSSVQADPGGKGAIMNVAEFYSSVKNLSETRQIADGSNHRPHYSMRTLARALTFAAEIASAFSLRRAIWEGCLMAFTMVLDKKSAEIVMAEAQKHLLVGVKNPRSLLKKDPAPPRSENGQSFVKFGPFYLPRGPLPEDLAEDYILTPSVEAKLIHLSRIILTGRFPVLIEGPTSSGKTSSIEYLARRTGHQFVRINNHEHTDIQEYIGSYVSDPQTGKLVYKDGLLVRALRNGEWIVLDELNLAPTDVLEALNRLLDDNRELVIPETQEVVRPHPRFMLFATQNPPGLYAGRKVLSRAFRNRFLEVHFDDVPQAELESILCQRARIAPSYATRIVSVFQELQRRRQSDRVFESKHAFATLRDLFRWAGRDAVGVQELAENGYMLLAERARRPDDKKVVKEVIESVLHVRIEEGALYRLQGHHADMASYLGCPVPSSNQLIWTAAMQRLFILIARALRFGEPVLLVGETGCGKTSVCQVYAEVVSKLLYTVNCHQNTETADLIGGLRPVRNRSEQSPLFEWRDGPLVESMKKGDVFLLDEISLADDSVLERLNSVLEPSRTLILAEMGGQDLDASCIRALPGFHFVATMNPGGDYGKKELSPALRNRFTEIWVPPVDDRADLELIVGSSWKHEQLKPFTLPLLDFSQWLTTKTGDRSVSGLRDILAWVAFSNASANVSTMQPQEVFHHAASMTFLDGLGSLPQLSAYTTDALKRLKSDAHLELHKAVPVVPSDNLNDFTPAYDPSKFIQLGLFAIPRGPLQPLAQSFSLKAPTTQDNATRVFRACQVRKPILLEGSPGVGKTTLISALANLSGYHLCRINLSDQTDLMDLFGSDLPVEGGGPGELQWKDAEFLQALQEGHWVLLDEMNLAPQAVLEGLNAVLDHRGTVYIPELGKSFTRHPDFRIFAAQNPVNQGGGRKGLPKSFVNRFTKVYIDELSATDLLLVCQSLFPMHAPELLRLMIAFNTILNDEICRKKSFARDGSPWEFNLRDIIRWATLMNGPGPRGRPEAHLHAVYLHRFRKEQDRVQARQLFEQLFGSSCAAARPPKPAIAPSFLRIGEFLCPRQNYLGSARTGRILHSQLQALESVGLCATNSWLSIITGSHETGKTELVRTLADLSGASLQEISLNSTSDAMDILGGFEQVNNEDRVRSLFQDTLHALGSVHRSATGSKERLSLAELGKLPPSQETSTPPLQTVGELINALPSEHESKPHLLQTLATLSSSTSAGGFEWKDGPLINAMERGHWLLIDGANLCNPSVLDRLNSLCEPNGVLSLNERGRVHGSFLIIRPHPHFRLFMAINPHDGELSRAMRNRGVEISLDTPPDEHDRCILASFHLRISPRVELYGPPLHDSIRRGLLSTTHQESTPAVSKLLSQFTSLSTATSPLAPLRSEGKTITAQAMVYFLARTVSPAYRSHTRRFLDVYSLAGDLEAAHTLKPFFEALPGGVLDRAIAGLCNQHCLTWGVPLSFLSAQPFDFFMNCARCSECSIISNPRSAHRSLTSIADLAVELFLHEQAKMRLPSGTRKFLGKMPETHQTVFRESMRIVEAVQICCLEFLEYLADAKEYSEMIRDIENVISLLQYSRKLQEALHTSTLNFSTLHGASSWIADLFKQSGTRFPAIQEHVAVLRELISPKSGLAMLDIWQSMLDAQSPRISDLGMQELDSRACNLPSHVKSTTIRRFSLQVICLQSLSIEPTEEELTSLEEISRSLDSIVSSEASTDSRDPDDFSLSLPLHLLEFEVLSGIHSSGEIRDSSNARVMEEVIELGLADERKSLLPLALIQQILWNPPGTQAHYPIIASLQRRWLNQLWSLAGPIEVPKGPESLFSPTILAAVLYLCGGSANTPRRPLSSVHKYSHSLENLSQIVLRNGHHPETRCMQIRSMLGYCITQLLQPFISSSPDIMPGAAQGHLTIDQPHSVHALSARIEALGNSYLTEAYRTLLEPALSAAALPTTTSRRVTILTLGHCWVALANFLRFLYIPDIPVDPAAIQDCQEDFNEEKARCLAAQVALHRQLSLVQTGVGEDELIAHLASASPARDQTSTNRRTTAAPRPDVSHLHVFWKEVAQFCEQVIDTTRVDSLLKPLEIGDPLAQKRESVLQDSIASFDRRLASTYSSYVDVGKPIQLSLSYLRFGLRLVRHSASLLQDDAIFTSLATFPTVASASQLLENTAEETFKTLGASYTPMLKLASVAVDVSIGLSAGSHMTAIEHCYEQLICLWHIDAAHELEKAQQGESLYKSKTVAHDTDESALEEQEFLSLFPSFEDVLGATPTNESPPQSSPKVHISTDRAMEIYHIHHLLFSQSTSPTDKEFHDLRSNALSHFMLSGSSSFSESMDKSSLAHQLALISFSTVRLHSSSTQDARYNFYATPHPAEVKKAADIATTLRGRVASLVQEWPDQMVLQHLLDRCDTFLALDFSSPLAKVLSALEQLLTQTDDWEMYSNRENTLAEYRQKMTSLVIEWRRLELTCWRGLLSSETAQFIKNDHQWWFRLYDTLIRSPREILERNAQEELDEYYRSLVPLLDDFLRTASLGQYSARLDLMKTFVVYLGELGRTKDASQRAVLLRTATITQNTVDLFSLHLTTISSHLSAQQAPLENEVKKLIKLASWKDVNIQALRQSSVRTHHQLYKIIRKFRGILQEPVFSFLQIQTATASQHSTPDPIIVSVPVPFTGHVFPVAIKSARHLTELEQTFQKFQTLVRVSVEQGLNSQGVEELETLATDVIITSHSLAEELPKRGSTKEKTIQNQKSLMVRKRKGWSDLLKALKGGGLSHNVKPDILRRQCDSSWIRSQRAISQFVHFQPEMPAQGLEFYHQRLLWLLPDLRSALPHHHADISTRELGRGVMLLESGFSLALEARRSLIEALSSYDQLHRLCQRLKMVSAQNHVIASGPSSGTATKEAYNSLRRWRKSLQEYLIVIDDCLRLSKGSAASGEASTRDSVQQMIAETSAWCNHLEKLVASMALTSFNVLLSEEGALLTKLNEFQQNCARSLQVWSRETTYLKPVLKGLQQWFSTNFIPATWSDDAASATVPQDLDHCIETLLVNMQRLKSENSIRGEQGEKEQYIREDHRKILKLTRLLNLQPTLDLITTSTSQACQDPPAVFQNAIDRFTPFLEAYLQLAERQLHVHASWTRTVYKLNYVLCSIMLSLARKGFCQPPEEEQGDAEGATETADGVGLGQGSGSDNVSKDIEDESQVEGLKGEEEKNEEREEGRDEDDDAIELSQDFDGALEDVPDDATEDGEQSGDEDEGMDEDIGELDPQDQNAVDEKLWGDEADPKDGSSEETTQQNPNQEESQQNSEMAAKDDRKKKSDSAKKEQEDQQVQNQEVDSEGAEDSIPEEEEKDDEAGEAGGAPMEDFVPETDVLDLPDDLNFDPSEVQQDPEQVDDAPEEQDEGGEPELDMEFTNDDGPEQQQPPADDTPGEDDVRMQDAPQEAEHSEEPSGEDEESDPHTTAKTDVGEGHDASLADDAQRKPQTETAATEQMGTQQGKSGTAASQLEEIAEDETIQPDEDHSEDARKPSADTNGSSSDGSGGQRGPATTQQQPLMQSNPLRNLGDALKEVRRQFDEILEREDSSATPAPVDTADPKSRLEYLLPDEEDQNMQALGSAEDHTTKLRDLHITEAEAQDDGIAPMDVDDISPDLPPPSLQQYEPQKRDPTSEAAQMDLEGAIPAPNPSSSLDSFASPDPLLPKAEAEVKEEEEHTEQELVRWQSTGYPEEESQNIWRLYSSLTHDLAYGLCEQLRLILEPTLATRLKGDYRTGKRLNMKKIVPYIASDFTKDKIWLRRTRPSQREYQVLIALDDSRSMAESHSVHLAYETLSLVTKALNRLEAGDVGIAKFGKTVEVLHGFDEGPFTDQAGADIINAFRFNQEATNVHALVESSLKTMEKARERSSSSSSDLWQLEIIISDGICQDHDKLKTALRKAEEQRVLIVFIIIDSLHSASSASASIPVASPPAHRRPIAAVDHSILSMTNAKLVNVDGRIELETERYLDSFPFQYYVILRNVESLPEVLSSTLKQFFERLSVDS